MTCAIVASRRRVDVELVRSVVFVAEHNRVESGRLESREVAGCAFYQTGQPRMCVMKRGPGQRTNVNHPDDRLWISENLLKLAVHQCNGDENRPLTAANTVLASWRGDCRSCVPKIGRNTANKYRTHVIVVTSSSNGR